MTAPEYFTDGRFVGAARWNLEVVAVRDSTPRTRVITFASEGIDELKYLPGQDFMFAMPSANGTTNRRYTVRRVDRDANTLDVAFFRHDSGPGTAWAEAATPGDHIRAIGPRGKISVNHDADWHLFVADDAAVPATMAMIESIAPGVDVLAWILVIDESERRPVNVNANASVTWLYHPTDLLDALRTATLPPGNGHVYLNGELQLVRQAAAIVRELGLDGDAVSIKNYWRRDQANKENGEPSRE